MTFLVSVSGLLFSVANGNLQHPCEVTTLNLEAKMGGDVIEPRPAALEIEITSDEKVMIIAEMETRSRACLSPPSLEWTLLPSSNVTQFSTRSLMDRPAEMAEYIGHLDARDATSVTDRIFVTIHETKQQPFLEAEVKIQVWQNKPRSEEEQ
jgi:hypothetical protein